MDCNLRIWRVNNMTRKMICVCVTKALAGEMPHDVSSKTPLVDIARGCWKVDDVRVAKCELLVAVNKGVVCGVWEIDRKIGWRKPASVNAIPTRTMTNIDFTRQYCEIKQTVPPERKQLMNKHIRMYGPVRYL